VTRDDPEQACAPHGTQHRNVPLVVVRCKNHAPYIVSQHGQLRHHTEIVKIPRGLGRDGGRGIIVAVVVITRPRQIPRFVEVSSDLSHTDVEE
jgi:hypothetical protein